MIFLLFEGGLFMCRKSVFLILLLAFGLTIGIASGQTSVRINFQSRTTGSREVPVGYLPDYGDLFGDRGNGWNYGWTITTPGTTTDKADSARDRDSSRSPDQRYDTLNCLTHYTTGIGFWEIAIPNATYNVFIVGGDPGYIDQENSYIVEGVEIIDTTPTNTAGNYFDQYNVTVTVEDGFLTIAPLSTTVWPICKICFVDIANVRCAQLVSPPDRGLWPNQSATLTWAPGVSAVQHDVYIGEDFNLVRDATTSMTPIYKGRQDPNNYNAANLTPGATYYWRVDEVNGNEICKGDVWFFKVQLLKAYDPQPIDGGLFVDPNDRLSWSKGATAANHLVYFGDDRTKVENATTSSPEYKTPSLPAATTTWDPPGSLNINTTYYWRIDEKESGGTVHKGDVWTFTTSAHFGGGLKAQYYNNMDLTGDPVLTRIDPKIDFDWGYDSPDPIVQVDGFSARWTGLVEIPADGEWTFSTHADDAVRLWIDGQQLINVWGNSRPLTWDSNTITLNAGFHTIEMNYFEINYAHTAIAHLAWQGPLVPVRQYIPQGALLPPFVASDPNPADNATSVRQTPTLSWTAGDNANQHDVYFGDNYDSVIDADITTANIYRGRQELEDVNYVPVEIPLQRGKTYYWRIDEIEAGGTIRKGFIWRFTVANYIVVDDFETYTDELGNRIYETWADYAVNNTGMTVGHFVPPYAERSIVHNGFQSMYMHYDNDGTVNEGIVVEGFNYEQSGTLLYSEAQREWTDPQDWTAEDVNSLTLWFRGIAASVGSFTAGPPVYTMTARGADIWDTSDQFHFAYKQLSGNGSIEARVISLTNTHNRAKAGVMIRETLDADSAYIMVSFNPEGRVEFLQRSFKGDTSAEIGTAATEITTPVSVRLTRSGNTFTAEYSATGIPPWTQLNSVDMPMMMDTYIGLIACSHDNNATCTAEFSNVTTSGTGDWQSQDIGIAYNEAEQIYVMLQDSAGISSPAVKYPDPAATTFNTWTEWNIPLTSFSSINPPGRINLQAVSKMIIGVGDRANTQPGGAGDLYIDDIRLYRP
jgi:regulation of enolase protein 1 (concanavalin A-like superfamily)